MERFDFGKEEIRFLPLDAGLFELSLNGGKAERSDQFVHGGSL